MFSWEVCRLPVPRQPFMTAGQSPTLSYAAESTPGTLCPGYYKGEWQLSKGDRALGSGSQLYPLLILWSLAIL